MPSRNRLRVRARLELKTDNCKDVGGPCFDFGLRLATGNFTDNISTNQTLTDFYERKPFTLERAFVRFNWKFDGPWKLELTAGKFEPTFRRAQMVWDDDVNVEGISEALSFSSGQKLYGVKLVAFQLPFNEAPAGKDGMLYGGQLQTDWKFGENSKADLNAGYYSWNHADLVLSGLGAATTQVNGGISNSAAVTGGQNGDLGTTNRIIRDPITGQIKLDATGKPIGFVANFNLFDVLGNYVWRVSPETPVRFTFDYVRNLSRRIDNENNGYWASIEVHRTKCQWNKGRWAKQNDDNCDELSKRGDLLLGYTFTRIQQDAVLVPFNFSDILASNSRVHIPTIAYVPHENVVLQWTGLFSQRANKIFPLSPVNRWLNRMQFDVIYKFK
ncbi:MAG TPA: putative porin [Pyrinomonadaceae bacterium]|nr:putative porin [Pyrinomonadaceae bacterium]